MLSVRKAPDCLDDDQELIFIIGYLFSESVDGDCVAERSRVPLVAAMIANLYSDLDLAGLNVLFFKSIQNREVGNAGLMGIVRRELEVIYDLRGPDVLDRGALAPFFRV